MGAQAAEKDQNLKDVLSKAAPTADDLNAVFSDVRESLPQTLANLAVVIEMLKRYHAGVEQVLVLLPQACFDRPGDFRAVRERAHGCAGPRDRRSTIRRHV